MVLELILHDVFCLARSFLLLSESNSALNLSVRFQKAGITKCSYGFKSSVVIGELGKGLDENFVVVVFRREGAAGGPNRGFLSRNLPLDSNVHHLRGFQDF